MRGPVDQADVVPRPAKPARQNGRGLFTDTLYASRSEPRPGAPFLLTFVAPASPAATRRSPSPTTVIPAVRLRPETKSRGGIL